MGVDSNHQRLQDGTVIKWEHFYYRLPNEYVSTSSIDSKNAEVVSTKEVFKRGYVTMFQFLIGKVKTLNVLQSSLPQME